MDVVEYGDRLPTVAIGLYDVPCGTAAIPLYAPTVMAFHACPGL